jgi:hypothetical protein
MSGANNAQGFPNFPASSGGTVTSVTAADGSVVIGGTAVAPTVRTGTLDVIATLHAPVASVALNAQKITGIAKATVSTDASSLANSLDQFAAPAADVPWNAKKITGIANGTLATDAAAFGQIPTVFGGIAHATKASDVGTTGTTFAGGADILAAALSFTADGSSDYIVEASSPGWVNGTAGNGMQARLNLDTADGGILSEVDIGTALGGDILPFAIRSILVAPSAGAHTVNIRINSVAGGTTTVKAGAGGAGTNGPALVTIRKA